MLPRATLSCIKIYRNHWSLQKCNERALPLLQFRIHTVRQLFPFFFNFFTQYTRQAFFDGRGHCPIWYCKKINRTPHLSYVLVPKRVGKISTLSWHNEQRSLKSLRTSLILPSNWSCKVTDGILPELLYLLGVFGILDEFSRYKVHTIEIDFWKQVVNPSSSQVPIHLSTMMYVVYTTPGDSEKRKWNM